MSIKLPLVLGKSIVIGIVRTQVDAMDLHIHELSPNHETTDLVQVHNKVLSPIFIHRLQVVEDT